MGSAVGVSIGWEWAGWEAQRGKTESTSANTKLDSRSGRVDTRGLHRSSPEPRSQPSIESERSGQRRVRGYSKSEPHQVVLTPPVSLVRERGAFGLRSRARMERRFAELVDPHVDAIYRTARRVGTRESDLEDLVQGRGILRKGAAFFTARSATASVLAGHIDECPQPGRHLRARRKIQEQPRYLRGVRFENDAQRALLDLPGDQRLIRIDDGTCPP
jgi:hypothetical protein